MYWLFYRYGSPVIFNFTVVKQEPSCSSWEMDTTVVFARVLWKWIEGVTDWNRSCTAELPRVWVCLYCSCLEKKEICLLCGIGISTDWKFLQTAGLWVVIFSSHCLMLKQPDLLTHLCYHVSNSLGLICAFLALTKMHCFVTHGEHLSAQKLPFYP